MHISRRNMSFIHELFTDTIQVNRLLFTLDLEATANTCKFIFGEGVTFLPGPTAHRARPAAASKGMQSHRADYYSSTQSRETSPSLGFSATNRRQAIFSYRSANGRSFDLALSSASACSASSLDNFSFASPTSKVFPSEDSATTSTSNGWRLSPVPHQRPTLIQRTDEPGNGFSLRVARTNSSHACPRKTRNGFSIAFQSAASSRNCESE